MSAFNKFKTKTTTLHSPIADLAKELSVITGSRKYTDSILGSLSISTEGISEDKSAMLGSVSNELEATITDIAKRLNVATESYALESAAMAGIYASNPMAFFQATDKMGINSTVNGIMPSVGTASSRRTFSVEAYDERENKRSQMNTIMYNLLSCRQNEFGETFYPTLIIPSTEVGITLSIPLLYVYNDFKRKANGAISEYNRKNIVRAYADSSILRSDLTRAVPVLRTGGGADDSSARFVPVDKIPAWTEDLGGGIVVTTAALKTGEQVEIIGLSQTTELLSAGVLNQTDNLDSYVVLDSIWLKSGADYIKIATSNIPSATFTYAPQGNYRKMQLSFETTAISLDKDTKTVTDGALATLPELATNSIRIQLSLSGSTVLDRGVTVVNTGKPQLVAMRSASGALITGTAFDTLATKVAAMEVVGYKLTAYRANSNIRQMGLLTDTQTETRVINVPYRAPIATLAPTMGATNVEDTSAIENLIRITGLRINCEAVSALKNHRTMLKNQKNVPDALGELPESTDIGHFWVKPYYKEEVIDLSLTVDSDKSHERLKDIQTALIGKIRFHVNEMYRQSEYSAASAWLTGNPNFKPTVIIGTDPVIANYLMIEGEPRTLGETFDFKIVSTINYEIKNQIFISFGVFDDTRNASLNPLNHGNMLWSPELTLVLPIDRGGQTSKEMIVTPRYAHINNLPLMVHLTVTGLPEVTGKVTKNMHTV